MLPPLLLDGWFVLHQLFRVEPAPAPGGIRSHRADEVAGLFAAWADLGDSGWSGAYRIVGGGAHLLALHLRPSLEALAEVESALRPSAAAGELTLVHDFLSVVELALYSATLKVAVEAEKEGVEPGTPAWESLAQDQREVERGRAHVQRRLYPRQPPELPFVNVYPMDRKREAGANWYRLPLEERESMMAHHGTVGRRYAGRISQIISGAIGLDDWEWMVTLFARDPLDFKRIITEMRYLESTARYAEFGSFQTGYRLDMEGLKRILMGEAGGTRI
ncbi:MAG: chlorite dismutase family protein [Gemmatimonadota bacterium]